MSRIFSFLMIYLLITGSGVLAQNSGSESEETNQKENNSEQETARPEKINQEQANEYPDPNLIPYRTKKSALVHVLSLPAKIWHLAWTPLGATVIWVEQSRIQEKAIKFFLNDDQTAGFFPLVSFGGNTGAGGGLMVFDNNLFNKRKRVKASFLYSSSRNNISEIVYADSSLFGSSFYFDVTGS